MARTGRFGRLPRAAQDLSSTIVSLIQQFENQRDQNIIAAWQEPGGGEFEGRRVDDERFLEWWEMRAKEVSKEDPMWDYYQQTLATYRYQIRQQKAELKYTQGKWDDADMMRFYANEAKRLPRNSAAWRELMIASARHKKALNQGRKARRSGNSTAALQQRLQNLYDRTEKPAVLVNDVINQILRQRGGNTGGGTSLENLGTGIFSTEEVKGIGPGDPGYTGGGYEDLSEYARLEQTLAEIENDPNWKTVYLPALKKADPSFNGNLTVDYVIRTQNRARRGALEGSRIARRHGQKGAADDATARAKGYETRKDGLASVDWYAKGQDILADAYNAGINDPSLRPDERAALRDHYIGRLTKLRNRAVRQGQPDVAGMLQNDIYRFSGDPRGLDGVGIGDPNYASAVLSEGGQAFTVGEVGGTTTRLAMEDNEGLDRIASGMAVYQIDSATGAVSIVDREDVKDVPTTTGIVIQTEPTHYRDKSGKRKTRPGVTTIMSQTDGIPMYAKVGTRSPSGGGIVDNRFDPTDNQIIGWEFPANDANGNRKRWLIVGQDGKRYWTYEDPRDTLGSLVTAEDKSASETTLYLNPQPGVTVSAYYEDENGQVVELAPGETPPEGVTVQTTAEVEGIVDAMAQMEEQQRQEDERRRESEQAEADKKARFEQWKAERPEGVTNVPSVVTGGGGGPRPTGPEMPPAPPLPPNVGMTPEQWAEIVRRVDAGQPPQQAVGEVLPGSTLAAGSGPDGVALMTTLKDRERQRATPEEKTGRGQADYDRLMAENDADRAAIADLDARIRENQDRAASTDGRIPGYTADPELNAQWERDKAEIRRRIAQRDNQALQIQQANPSIQTRAQATPSYVPDWMSGQGAPSAGVMAAQTRTAQITAYLRLHAGSLGVRYISGNTAYYDQDQERRKQLADMLGKDQAGVMDMMIATDPQLAQDPIALGAAVREMTNVIHGAAMNEVQYARDRMDRDGVPSAISEVLNEGIFGMGKIGKERAAQLRARGLRLSLNEERQDPFDPDDDARGDDGGFISGGGRPSHGLWANKRVLTNVVDDRPYVGEERSDSLSVPGFAGIGMSYITEAQRQAIEAARGNRPATARYDPVSRRVVNVEKPQGASTIPTIKTAEPPKKPKPVKIQEVEEDKPIKIRTTGNTQADTAIRAGIGAVIGGIGGRPATTATKPKTAPGYGTRFY